VSASAGDFEIGREGHGEIACTTAPMSSYGRAISRRHRACRRLRSAPGVLQK